MVGPHLSFPADPHRRTWLAEVPSLQPQNSSSSPVLLLALVLLVISQFCLEFYSLQCLLNSESKGDGKVKKSKGFRIISPVIKTYVPPPFIISFIILKLFSLSEAHFLYQCRHLGLGVIITRLKVVVIAGDLCFSYIQKS